ncbi:hypothetical protein HDC93_007572 [Streptomyces sp. AK010]|nr:hypothetical protein [Streptomyces sp. AK010]
MSAVHVIADDAEALAVAAELAVEFRREAAERDVRRRLPHAELDRLSASGLPAVSVPAEFGGADVGAGTLAEIFRMLAAADASLAQIPQSHFVYVNVLRRQGTHAQQEFFFGEVLRGRRFGNAQSEAGTKHVQDIRTRLARRPDGSYVLDGVKHYSTGALFAHWIPVLARADEGTLHVAYVPHDAPGLTVVDDWDGMGQRTTASGTVRLEGGARPRRPGRTPPPHLPGASTSRSSGPVAAPGSSPRISAPAAANSATASRSAQSGMGRANSRLIVAWSWSGRSSSGGPGATGRVPTRVSAENALGWSRTATWATIPPTPIPARWAGPLPSASARAAASAARSRRV